MVFPWVGGGTFLEFIECQSTEERAAYLPRFVSDMWRALDFMQASGVSNGDLKPDNVMFDGHNFTVVDFGHSSTDADVNHGRCQPRDMEWIGAYCYRSPERLFTSLERTAMQKLPDHTTLDIPSSKCHPSTLRHNTSGFATDLWAFGLLVLALWQGKDDFIGKQQPLDQQTKSRLLVPCHAVVNIPVTDSPWGRFVCDVKETRTPKSAQASSQSVHSGNFGTQQLFQASASFAELRDKRASPEDVKVVRSIFRSACTIADRSHCSLDSFASRWRNGDTTLTLSGLDELLEVGLEQTNAAWNLASVVVEGLLCIHPEPRLAFFKKTTQEIAALTPLTAKPEPAIAAPPSFSQYLHCSESGTQILASLKRKCGVFAHESSSPPAKRLARRVD